MTRVLVIGAGPSSVQASHRLLELGCEVQMIDFGVSGLSLETTHGFLQTRQEDPAQSELWWGKEYSGFPMENRPGGAGLTPQRSFVLDEVASWTPVRSREFFPVESLAKGGLGEAWGLGAFRLSSHELVAMGLDPAALSKSYARVIERVGVSDSHVRDEAAERLYARGRAHEAALLRAGVKLGPVPLALLDHSVDGRKANTYDDMDFYINPGRSAFRPAFAIDALQSNPRFTYSKGWLVVRLHETEVGVVVEALSRENRELREFKADRVVLCAGTLGTARLVLRSQLLQTSQRTHLSLACSPYYQLVAVQPALVGRRLRDRRHSLGQFVMSYEDPEHPERVPLASVLSYRSLLLTRLLREAPLPVREGRSLLQILQSGLTVAGIFLPQKLDEARVSLRLEDDANSPTGDCLLIEALKTRPNTTEESAMEFRTLRVFRSALRTMGAWTLRSVALPAGSSIHYGGTLPLGVHTALDSGRLAGTRRIYIGDGSAFRMVPGRGITLTLMAYADWVAEQAARG